MSTPSLTDFLLARIEADERAAQKLAETDRRPVLSLASTVNHPTRILLECEAKRQILGMLWFPASEADHPSCEYAQLTLELLARPYADHPDWREEWRP